MHRTVTVSEVFGPAIRGSSKFTRKYMRENPGPHPVFSASTAGPVGWIDTFDHEGDYLSWSTNGYAGRTMVVRGLFSSTSDRAFLAPLLDDVSLDYCRIVLAPKFEQAARGRRQPGRHRNEYTKLSPGAVQDIEFDLPFTDDGYPDLETQLAFVSRWSRSHEFQLKAAALASSLARATVLPQFESDKTTREVRLMDSEVFQFLKTETGWLKKNWVSLNTDNPDDYPVYSAAKGPVAHVSVETEKLIDASEDDPVLSFAVDGDGSAGTNFVLHRTPFYVSTNRATFRSVRPDVDLEFVYFALQTMKADYGFGFNYKAYAAHLQDVVLNLPETDGDNFDVGAQRSMVHRIAALYEMRAHAVAALAQISEARVSLG